jgi:hypothetical protein
MVKSAECSVLRAAGFSRILEVLQFLENLGVGSVKFSIFVTKIINQNPDSVNMDAVRDCTLVYSDFI